MGCAASMQEVAPSQEKQTRRPKRRKKKRSTLLSYGVEVQQDLSSQINPQVRQKRKRFFGEYPTPELLREANIEYVIENRRKKELDENGLPLVVPSAVMKEDTIQRINISKLDAHATQVSDDFMDKPLKEFVKFLCKPAKKSAERARVIFVWLATTDLAALDDEREVKDGSVMDHLIKVRDQRTSHAALFAHMCEVAKLHAVEIRGLVKSGEVEPGNDVPDGSLGTWVAVWIKDTWMLFDPHWASRGKQCVDGGEWELADGDGEGAQSTESNGGLKYKYDNFFFMTDPEEFIYSHFPLEDNWQLLARPVTRREFNSLAYLKPGFFRKGLQIKSHRRCVIKAPHGEVDISLEMTQKRRFVHRLWMWSKDKPQRFAGNLDLSRFILRKVKGNKQHIHLEFPMPGKYKFELFVCEDEDSSTSYELACTYIIMNQEAKEDIQPLPVNHRKEWGPGLDMNKAGLKPMNHDDAVIEADHGVTRLRFKARKNIELMHSLHSNEHSKEKLKNYVVHYKDGDDLVIDVKLPTAGDYALNLFAKDADSEGGFPNVCSYLLTTDQGAFDQTPYPSIHRGYAGLTSAGQEDGVYCLSHKTAIIEAPESGQLDIIMGMPRDFAMMGNLVHQNGKEEENMDKFMHTSLSNDQTKFQMRFPEPGVYSLKVFGGEKGDEQLHNVYNILIKVPTPKAKCPTYPTTFSAFRDTNSQLDAPLTGTLPANKMIPVSIKVSEAKEVAVVNGNGWHYLVKDKYGNWRGDTDTGQAGSELMIAAKMNTDQQDFSTLVSYEIVNENEIVKQAEIQETRRVQVQKKNQNETELIQERSQDVDTTHQALCEAIKERNAKDLSRLLKYIEKKKYISHMRDDYEKGKKLLSSLDRIEKLQRAILNLDAALIAEIRRYSKPPQLVHEVMIASLLLLGDHEGKTRDWAQCQKLCNTIGPTGLLRRVKEFDVQELHPEIAAQANQLISQYRLDDVLDKSAGAATFYSWAMGMTEELKMVKEGADRAQPAGLRRQKEIFSQNRFRKR